MGSTYEYRLEEAVNQLILLNYENAISHHSISQVMWVMIFEFKIKDIIMNLRSRNQTLIISGLLRSFEEVDGWSNKKPLIK